jgi:hypothetical protein
MFMRFLKEVMGANRRLRVNTSEDPLRLKDPIIGYLNLLGHRGHEMMVSDSGFLSPLFRTAIKSESEVPRCQVLFLYCDLNAAGRIDGRAETG